MQKVSLSKYSLTKHKIRSSICILTLLRTLEGKCNPAVGCSRTFASGGGDSGCIGCLKRGSGCDDDSSYCIVGYRPQTCTYDSDCGNDLSCMISPYPNFPTLCGLAGNTSIGQWCSARSAAVRRDLEWASVLNELVGEDGIIFKEY